MRKSVRGRFRFVEEVVRDMFDGFLYDVFDEVWAVWHLCFGYFIGAIVVGRCPSSIWIFFYKQRFSILHFAREEIAFLPSSLRFDSSTLPWLVFCPSRMREKMYDSRIRSGRLSSSLTGICHGLLVAWVSVFIVLICDVNAIVAKVKRHDAAQNTDRPWTGKTTTAPGSAIENGAFLQKRTSKNVVIGGDGDLADDRDPDSAQQLDPKAAAPGGQEPAAPVRM